VSDASGKMRRWIMRMGGATDRNTEKLTMRSMGTDEKRDEVEVVGK
jgi:hypothetical protein